MDRKKGIPALTTATEKQQRAFTRLHEIMTRVPAKPREIIMIGGDDWGRRDDDFERSPVVNRRLSLAEVRANRRAAAAATALAGSADNGVGRFVDLSADDIAIVVPSAASAVPVEL
jgi:hypothetical protein